MSENEPDLRALLEAATPGPWQVLSSGAVAGQYPGSRILDTVADTFPTGNGPKHNAALIAALRNEAAALLDDRDRLRALEAAVGVVMSALRRGSGGKTDPFHVGLDASEHLERLLATRPDNEPT